MGASRDKNHSINHERHFLRIIFSHVPAESAEWKIDDFNEILCTDLFTHVRLEAVQTAQIFRSATTMQKNIAGRSKFSTSIPKRP
jgi:hypothetical protein